MFHTNLEKELLFYFNKISEEDKKEIIEFTKIKAQAFITEKLLLQILFFMVSKEAIFNTMEITISLHALYFGFRKPLVFFSTSLRVTII